MNGTEHPEDKVARLMREAAQKRGSAGEKAGGTSPSSVVNISTINGDFNLVIIQAGCA